MFEWEGGQTNLPEQIHMSSQIHLVPRLVVQYLEHTSKHYQKPRAKGSVHYEKGEASVVLYLSTVGLSVEKDEEGGGRRRKGVKT